MAKRVLSEKQKLNQGRNYITDLNIAFFKQIKYLPFPRNTNTGNAYDIHSSGRNARHGIG